ncbi:MAG: peroxiredoxin [Pseudomonadota bacterium]|nr:peroxiredoxin [Burkholderiales bacterium]MDQ3196392.1 peroxiredoxin [Pseudomonadota bacterium]
MKWILLYATLLGIVFLVWRGLAHAGVIPEVGQPAPQFMLPDQHGKTRSLEEFAGKWLVLYFYPKDDTPGCTEQACKFRDDLQQLTAMGAEVVGVSVDTSASHAEFAKKYSLPFPLLADENGEVARRYGSVTNLYVAKFAKRNTFLIDPQGRIARVYLKADTSRNSAQVIDDLKQLAAK